MNKYSWTEPYFGVSHLNINTKNFQVTLEESHCFTIGYILSLKSDKVWSEPIFKTVGNLHFVRTELEKKSKELMIVSENCC